MTEKEIRELKIGDKVRLTLTDLFGDKSYVTGTVSKILTPDVEEADEFGYYFYEVYATAMVEGEYFDFRVTESAELI